MQGMQKLIIDKTQITNQQDIANAFNKYFSSVNNSVSNSDKIDNIKHSNPSTYSNCEQG
jgi:RNAse (barnase) inhibitor barstar